jgi:tetratricopeptide (TPR) repeat protein
MVRLAPAGSPEAAQAELGLKELQEARAAIELLEVEIDRLPIEQCGESYLKLGKLRQKLRDPIAFDDYFLASDLLPRAKEPLELLLAGLRGSHDIFLRIHLLGRLLALAPGSEPALGELAGMYLKLHVRLDEAKRLAAELHRLRPSPLSYRLLGELALAGGKSREALGLLRQGQERYPGDAALKEAVERAARKPQ